MQKKNCRSGKEKEMKCEGGEKGRIKKERRKNSRTETHIHTARHTPD